jgi:hypothetical protein
MLKNLLKWGALTGGAMLWLSVALAEDEAPMVTPYRPTVSNPAQLSHPGWLEVESGFNRSLNNDKSSRNNLPYTLKYALSWDFGIMVGGDAHVSQSEPPLSGVGDTLFLIKQRKVLSDSSALGVEYGMKSATAKEGLGSGKTDYIVNGIYSTDVSGHTIDLNLGMYQLGGMPSNEGQQQFTWATTLSRPVGQSWTLAAELSGSARQGTAPLNQYLLAASYAMNRRVVWDVGFARGISSDTPQWGLFFGVAFLAGKVF